MDRMSNVMTTPALSSVQRRLMEWMSQGWSARCAYGSAVHINGARVCNIDTMQVLERQGLVWRDPDTRVWKATDAGRALNPNAAG